MNFGLFFRMNFGLFFRMNFGLFFIMNFGLFFRMNFGLFRMNFGLFRINFGLFFRINWRNLGRVTSSNKFLGETSLTLSPCQPLSGEFESELHTYANKKSSERLWCSK
jgi:hypothetical protein